MMTTKPPTSAAASAGEVTLLLYAWSQGDCAARDRLWSIIYDELRRLARHQRRHEYSLDALETTALVHEAYLKMVGEGAAGFNGRAHFFAIAARVMRRLLVDTARARNAQKRGGGSGEAPDLDTPVVRPNFDLLELEDALQRLAALDERQASLVELRFFGGLTEQEAAEVLGISVPTLKREWALARAWLFRALSEGGS